MKLQKQMIITLFVVVALLFLSFSAYCENVNNVMINSTINSKDVQVDNVLKIYEQLYRCDGNRIEGIVDKNIVWIYDGVVGSVPFAGAYKGKEGVKNFWKTYFNSIIPLRLEFRYYLHEGNIVHLHWTEEGIAKQTGKRYIMETAQRWEFNDKGELVKFRWYNDTFAMYHAFQPSSNPQLSLAQHREDYHVNGDGPVNALPIVQKLYTHFLQGNLPELLGNVANNAVILFAGPQGIDPVAITDFGPQGMLHFLTTLLSNEQFEYIHLLSFTTDGCRVDVEIEEKFTVYTTGKLVVMPGLHSIVINSRGQVAKLRSYNDTYIVTWGYTN